MSFKGRKFTAEHKQKLRLAKLGRKYTVESKRNMSKAKLGNTNCLGRKLTEETKQKMSKALCGRKLTEETKQKMSKAQLGNTNCLGRKHTEETKQKMSKTRLGKKGKKLTAETKHKIREAKIKWIECQHCDGQPLSPTIGKNETQILNNLEKNIGYKIIRQYRVIGYFLDGYCKELNLAIEVDEEHHQKQKGADAIRENNIKNELNCDFLRLNDVIIS